MISVHQIYYNEQTKAFLDDAFYPYHNPVKDEYFENAVLRHIYELNPALKNRMQYIGVTSWKQKQKTHLSGAEIIARINADIVAGTQKDVYIVTPKMDMIDTWSNYPDQPREISGIIRAADGWRGLKERNAQFYADACMLNNARVLPCNLFDGIWQYSYANYWIARREVFDEYVRNWLIPALDFYRRVEPMMPKHYRPNDQAPMTTSICLVLERLFGSFLAHSNYSFDYLIKARHQGLKNRQWVKIVGYENTNPLIEEPGPFKVQS